jgi:hypothetical protein
MLGLMLYMYARAERLLQRLIAGGVARCPKKQKTFLLYEDGTLVESPEGPNGPVNMQRTEGVYEEKILIFPPRLMPNEKNSVQSVKLCLYTLLGTYGRY